MPTITVNKKEFLKLVGKNLNDEQLKDRISMLGTNVEKINDKEITVEIFPNRPDLLSEQGLARALSSFLGVKKGLKKYNIIKSVEKVIIENSVKDIRPFTACAIVKEIRFTDEKIKEIIQIQEKLHVTYGRNRKKLAIGIYPYEKIRPPIRYLAKKPEDIHFRPLEYPTVLNGREILSKHPAGREYGFLLEGKNKFPIFIDAEGKILSMPPIINSHDTGKITEQTKDVFVECSGFDLEVLKVCLNIIVTALADMGGKIYSMQLCYSNKKIETPDLTPRKMKFDIKYAEKRIGVKLNESDVKKLFEKMGHEYKNKTVYTPAYRADILHPIDFVEDIAIAYGYENFKEEIPKVAAIAEEDKFEIFKRKIAEIIIGLGLIETHTYNLTSNIAQTGKMGYNAGDLKCVALANPRSDEYSMLRAWVIPSLMQILSENKHREYPQKIFTIGEVFKADEKSETGFKESIKLGIVLCHKDADFTEIKQTMDALFSALGLEYKNKDTEHESFIPGRVGRININGKDVAYIGEVHPKVLVNWGLEFPAVGFELNLTELFSVFS